LAWVMHLETRCGEVALLETDLEIVYLSVPMCGRGVREAASRRFAACPLHVGIFLLGS
jgi:hypothetical protein